MQGRAQVKVDSKFYGLPQTRMRGYLFVWRPSVIKGAPGQDVGELWEELMRFLEAPVTLSLDHFLLPDSDDRVRPPSGHA